MRLIDKDALMTWFDNHYDDEEVTVGFVSGLIKEQPTIEERKVGKWRYSRNISSISYSDMMITCDQCGYTKERSHDDVFNFCPSCGAKMEGNT